MFISYRGEDSHSYGALLYRDLIDRFGRDLVFLDAESTPAGADFVKELLDRVRSARLLLAVIGPRWLTAPDLATGQRRIDDPDDWVRRELAEAFTAGVRVIPVLTDHAELPTAADLPSDISALSRCQYRHLRRREPMSDLARIATDLVSIDPALAAAARSRAGEPRHLPAAQADERLHMQAEGGCPEQVMELTGDVPSVLERQVLTVTVTRSRAQEVPGEVIGAPTQHGQLPGTEPRTALQAALGQLPSVPPRGPRQLPMDTAMFTGRAGELERLLALAEQAESAGLPGTVVITAIAGLGGIGKTALAVHAAHCMAQRFPDGQLFVDLHGFTQDSAPRDPGDALATLLGALGLPPGRIPADPEARAALYRDRLAGTRTLILLDNALDEAQVRPLLPATENCMVLITSRRRLKALDDALPVALDVLPLGEAVTLLRKAACLDGDATEEALLQRAADLCGRLPLALMIAGALLRTGGKAWNLPVLLNRLADRRPGNELASYTDETRSLGAVFDLSYRYLPEDARLLFRRLGLLPGPEVDAYAVTSLLAGDLDEASRLLQRLADHSLLIGSSPGRYRLHDLVRAHAHTLAVALDPADDRGGAQDRLLHYYAHTAQTASLPIARLPRLIPSGPGPARSPELTDPDTARAWLRAEYANIEAAHASSHARETAAIALAAGMAEILQTDGPWGRALEIHQAAANAAERLNQPTARATALNDLGRMRYQTGDYPGAADAFASALKIFRRIGNQLGEANALTNAARVSYVTGDFPGSVDAFASALEIYRRIGNQLGEANALTDLGHVQHLAGADPQASDAILQALDIFRQVGNRLGEANALNDLGHVRSLTGDHQGSVDAHMQSLAISCQIGNRLGEANALAHLAHVWHITGEFQGATDASMQAAKISRHFGDAYGEANALNYLGRVQHATGQYQRAVHTLMQALAIYRRIGLRSGEAGALHYLGRVQHSTGQYQIAAHTLTQALEIFHRIGNRSGEVWVLTHYAATIAAIGDHSRALMLYQRALTRNREINNPAEEARCLEGIAEHHLDTGDTALGVEHLHQALHIYRSLGMRPDINRVTDHLAGLPPK